MLKATFIVQLNKAISVAKDYLKGRDSSHDFAHAVRVMNLALTIAIEEKVSSDVFERIHIAALFHDLEDAKYTDPANQHSIIPDVLHKCGFTDPQFIARVEHIIDHVSYSKEKKRTQPISYDIDMAIVQDADRLEALGAIGIARCCAFAGARDGSMEEMLAHMQSKLPDVVARMKTKTGAALAKQRYKLVEQFCKSLTLELVEINYLDE
jgi:uncharacterized protein